MSGRVAVLEHSASDLPGLVGQHLESLGFELQHVRADLAPEPLPRPAELSAVVVMGSIESVTGGGPRWLARERDFVSECVAGHTPVLGICFGGQLLVDVLGGTVRRAAEVEVGWREVEVVDEAEMTAGPWLVWHEDEFLLPPGAALLARTDLCAQAFAAGPHLGVQFHPEIDEALLDLWFDDARSRGDLKPDDAEVMAAGLARFGRSSGEQARSLVDRFLSRL